MRGPGISQRRACQLVGVDPKTVRRERPSDCPKIREEMKEIAGKRRRFGYRRIGILLERKGMTMNHKKLYRLYREEGLSVKRRRGRKGTVRNLVCEAMMMERRGASHGNREEAYPSAEGRLAETEAPVVDHANRLRRSTRRCADGLARTCWR